MTKKKIKPAFKCKPSKKSPLRLALERQAEDGEFELVFFDGLDGAIVGLIECYEQHGHNYRVLYDRAKCIEILAKGMGKRSDEEEQDLFGISEEFLDFNITGAYVGPQTPAFLTVVSPEC